jgi:1-phosphofructokinase/tagatose 6-phosphate kinase
MLRNGSERTLLSAKIDPGVVEARSTVGSGDAFLAGFVAARYQHGDPERCLRFAVGCGAESIQHFGAGVLDPREVERLLPEVQVERLPEPALQSRS